MKLFLFGLAMAMIITSCGTSKILQQPKTLAQECAEKYPCADSIQLVTVEVEAEIDSQGIFKLLMGNDSIFWRNQPVNKFKIFDWSKMRDSITHNLSPTTPPIKPQRARIIITKTVTAKLDIALRQAYKDLQAQYQKSIEDLKRCNEAIKQKPKPKSDWKVWLILFGLLMVVVVQVLGNFLPSIRR
jgi:hypothetical protein